MAESLASYDVSSLFLQTTSPSTYLDLLLCCVLLSKGSIFYNLDSFQVIANLRETTLILATILGGLFSKHTTFFFGFSFITFIYLKW